MGAKSALSVEQYLHTSFDGLDKEYRDGELVERSSPTYSHGEAQGLLLAFFVALRKSHALFACSETRMKLRTGLYLIPDVAVFHGAKPAEVPENPPLVAIEILSPEDRLSTVAEKLDEYRTWGVAHTWVVDPVAKRFYDYDGRMNEGVTLRIPELGIELEPGSIFE